MSTDQGKIACFEYFLSKVLEWYHEVNGTSGDDNDLSKLKVLKLLFFASALKQGNDYPLLDGSAFSKFHAMPFGPVELDIYQAINSGLLSNYKVTNSKTIKLHDKPLNVEVNCQHGIDNAINTLKNSTNLITKSAMEVVDISHKWDSWKICFGIAKRHYRNIEPMPVELIKEDSNIFE